MFTRKKKKKINWTPKVITPSMCKKDIDPLEIIGNFSLSLSSFFPNNVIGLLSRALPLQRAFHSSQFLLFIVLTLFPRVFPRSRAVLFFLLSSYPWSLCPSLCMLICSQFYCFSCYQELLFQFVLLTVCSLYLFIYMPSLCLPLFD